MDEIANVCKKGFYGKIKMTLTVNDGVIQHQKIGYKKVIKITG